MSKKKPLEIDMIAGSQLRDTQGEMLSVEGADISDLIAGRGRFNDNHGKGFYNSIGRVTYAKKIFKAEDCNDERQKYYYEKVKAPYVYVRGFLYDDEDHPNAKAAAAILRNVHKADAPLKIKASVEGGVISRGVSDQSLLARTKIHSVALTFTPANNATLVEPTSLDKSFTDEAADMELIKSVAHLAESNVPSFRHITRHASAGKILNNIDLIRDMANQLGISESDLNIPSQGNLIKQAVEFKIFNNIKKINELMKQAQAPETYHIHKDGFKITSEPVTLDHVNNKYGGVKKLEASGHMLVPTKLNKSNGEDKIKNHLPIYVHPTKSYKLDGSKNSPTIHPVDPNDDPMHEHTHAPTHHEYAKEYTNFKPEVGIAHKALAHHYDGSKKLNTKELNNHKATLKAHYYKDMNKALMAGYGGAGAPTSASGGTVIQSESLDDGRSFKYIGCNDCGKEQVYHKYQVKCRHCNKSFPLEKLYGMITPK